MVEKFAINIMNEMVYLICSVPDNVNVNDSFKILAVNI